MAVESTVGGHPMTTGENVVRIEAEALRALADRIAGPMAADFDRTVAMLHACTGRVVVTGMGKSGIIGRKIAATLSSTGTPSLFMHPAEAIHGDLGMLVSGDCVIALSSSGETEEIIRLLATIKRMGAKLISMTGDDLYSGSHKRSTLAAAADIALDCSVAAEACSLGLAPTASTTTMLALGDALAVALSEKRGFKEEDFASLHDFANLHPGGKLGKKLARVHQLMHSGTDLPRVSAGTKMSDVIYEMSRKGLGLTTVLDGDKLLGVISDGDLRRQLEKHGRTPGSKDVLELTARDCMTPSPKTISPDEFALTALNIMEQKKITSLVVTDAQQRALGIIHLHDLWGTESI
jgi:arabinose-5-phosphate isomerase